MPDDLTLADAISMLRADLLSARARGATEDIQLPVQSLTLELQVVASRTKSGTIGFSVPVVNAGLGGNAAWEHEATQTVTIVFGAPVDHAGNPVPIARATDEMIG